MYNVSLSIFSSLLQRLALLSVLMLPCVAMAVQQSQQPPYLFGVPPIYDEQVIQQGFEPMMTYLSEALDHPVKLQVSESYEILRQNLGQGKVHFALLGPNLYVETKTSYPELHYLATAQQTGEGGTPRSWYYSHLLTHRDSDLRQFSDLQGKRFAYASQHSTSGYRFPRYYFPQRGIDPQQWFGAVSFSGGHSRSTDQLAERTLDVAASYDVNLWAAEKKHGKIFRTIARIGPIVNLALVAGHQVAEDQRFALTQALLWMPDSLRNPALPFVGFEVLSDRSYDPVRKVLQFDPEPSNSADQMIDQAVAGDELGSLMRVVQETELEALEFSILIQQQLLGREYHLSSAYVVGQLHKLSYAGQYLQAASALQLQLSQGALIYLLPAEGEPLPSFEWNRALQGRVRVVGSKNGMQLVLRWITDDEVVQ